MKLAIVIPVTAGREENLDLVLSSIRGQEGYPSPPIVIVDDGGTLARTALGLGCDIVRVAKHQPGMEQPRNVGVRHAEVKHRATHVWFLDSDVVVHPDALAEISFLLREDGNRVLVAPYDWLGPGLRPSQPVARDERFWREARAVRNDPRWEMFEASPSDKTYRLDLSAGLACFSGNLVWPVEHFKRVGGFWSEIHHGRCEDGELGLRAVAMDVPISFARHSPGWHMWHPVNGALAIQRNRRDVPMLNERHPWVQQGAVFMVDRDGKAFDVECPICECSVPTIGWWQHAADAGHEMELEVSSR